MDNTDDDEGMYVGASVEEALINQVEDVFRRVVAGDIMLDDTDDESDGPKHSDDDEPEEDNLNVEGTRT